MSEDKEKKFMGPVKVPVGVQSFKLTGASIKAGKSNPDSEIMHLTFSKVLPNGDIDVAYKPIKEFVGVKHSNKVYMEISTKKVDGLLKKLGIPEGIAQFNGNIAILASKEFKKEFGQEEFEAEVYQSKTEETFTLNGKEITFKRHIISLGE